MTKIAEKKEPIDFSSFVVSDFEEENNVRYSTLSFRLGDAQYQFMIANYHRNGETLYVKELRHQNRHCPFCTDWIQKESRFCSGLERHQEELFQRVLTHSKNRLRWFTVNFI